jgi:hypothetical protein
MEANMQKWEYLDFFMNGSDFAVISSNGEYFTDDYYKAIDPEGYRGKLKTDVWTSGMGKSKFLLTILDKLGADGWEAVGNISAGTAPSTYLLLKRPTNK